MFLRTGGIAGPFSYPGPGANPPMPESIDEATVRHIAKLARLELSDDEVRRYTGQLGEILAYVQKLNEVDTRSTEPTAHALPVTNVLRDDEPKSPLGAEKVLA